MDTSQSSVILQTKHLSKQVYVNKQPLQILSNIDLTIYKGQTIAILGASGSGKSTLLGLLAGLDTPSAGNITLCEKPLHTLTEDERAQLRANNVGFIFQNFQLISSLTALENVLLPLELNGAIDAVEQAQVMLTRVGLAARMHQYPKFLSGGEQQRVGIARAFVTHPKILFSDELTANLDRQTGLHIAELLFAMNAEYHTTLIVVTHDDYLAKRCQICFELINGNLSRL